VSLVLEPASRADARIAETRAYLSAAISEMGKALDRPPGLAVHHADEAARQIRRAIDKAELAYIESRRVAERLRYAR
jgi:hypothetical protein